VGSEQWAAQRFFVRLLSLGQRNMRNDPGLLRTAHCPLLTIFTLLRAAHRTLLTIFTLLRTAHRTLLTIFTLLLTAHCPLLTVTAQFSQNQGNSPLYSSRPYQPRAPVGLPKALNGVGIDQKLNEVVVETNKAVLTKDEDHGFNI